MFKRWLEYIYIYIYILMTRINVTRINYSGNYYLDFDVVHAVNTLGQLPLAAATGFRF